MSVGSWEERERERECVCGDGGVWGLEGRLGLFPTEQENSTF